MGELQRWKKRFWGRLTRALRRISVVTHVGRVSLIDGADRHWVYRTAPQPGIGSGPSTQEYPPSATQCLCRESRCLRGNLPDCRRDRGSSMGIGGSGGQHHGR